MRGRITVQSRESHSKLGMRGKMGWGAERVRELSKWKGRERVREDSHQLTKKWAFIIYSFEMQKQGGRYWTYPTKPSSLSRSHLHWKSCRVRVKAEAYWASRHCVGPLEPVHTPTCWWTCKSSEQRQGKQHSLPPLTFLAAMHNTDTETRVNTQVWCMLMSYMVFRMLSVLLLAWVDWLSEFRTW